MTLLLGLDGEMSDSEISNGAVLIQIGVCDLYGNTFGELIGHQKGWYKSEEASKVHCIPDEDILLAAPASSIDDRLSRWLKDRLTDASLRGQYSGIRPFVPVGWNVGGFDMPFVRKFLPNSSNFISRRALDLNALCFSFEQSGVTYEGERCSFSKWKQLAHDYVATCFVETQWHDALFDARAALKAYEFLSGVFVNSDYSPR